MPVQGSSKACTQRHRVKQKKTDNTKTVDCLTDSRSEHLSNRLHATLCTVLVTNTVACCGKFSQKFYRHYKNCNKVYSVSHKLQITLQDILYYMPFECGYIRAMT